MLFFENAFPMLLKNGRNFRRRGVDHPSIVTHGVESGGLSGGQTFELQQDTIFGSFFVLRRIKNGTVDGLDFVLYLLSREINRMCSEVVYGKSPILKYIIDSIQSFNFG